MGKRKIADIFEKPQAKRKGGVLRNAFNLVSSVPDIKVLSQLRERIAFRAFDSLILHLKTGFNVEVSNSNMVIVLNIFPNEKQFDKDVLIVLFLYAVLNVVKDDYSEDTIKINFENTDKNVIEAITKTIPGKMAQMMYQTSQYRIVFEDFVSFVSNNLSNFVNNIQNKYKNIPNINPLPEILFDNFNRYIQKENLNIVLNRYQNKVELLLFRNNSVIARIDVHPYEDEIHIELLEVSNKFRGIKLGENLICVAIGLYQNSKTPNTKIFLNAADENAFKYWEFGASQEVFDYLLKNGQLKLVNFYSKLGFVMDEEYSDFSFSTVPMKTTLDKLIIKCKENNILK